MIYMRCLCVGLKVCLCLKKTTNVHIVILPIIYSHYMHGTPCSHSPTHFQSIIIVYRTTESIMYYAPLSLSLSLPLSLSCIYTHISHEHQTCEEMFHKISQNTDPNLQYSVEVYESHVTLHSGHVHFLFL